VKSLLPRICWVSLLATLLLRPAYAVDVRGIRLWAGPDNTRVVLDLSASAQHTLKVLKNPDRVVLAYTIDSRWRNRSEFLLGRDQIRAFLVRKWQRELEYALRKDLWAFSGDRIAVRFQYEWHDRDGQCWRSYGNENWEFDEHGLMRRREASINDVAITAAERRIEGPRAPGDLESIPLR
jgi:nuclear transport factor 2 (NTF2) superfamily protein